MKLNYIRFIFENCDSVTIDGRYIGRFLVDKIETAIRRIACNSIDRIDTANRVAIEIHKNANIDYEEFGQPDWKRSIFNRISDGDITSIEFVLIKDIDDDHKIEKYSYYVNWVGDSDYNNDAQKVYISKLGNLYLVICKDESIDDCFDMTEINNDGIMNFNFNMCNAG